MSTNYIDQIKDTQSTPVTHDIQEATDIRIFRATCSTAASTVAKVATLQDPKNFSLTTGVKVAVTFQYGNTQSTPTLRVDGSSTGTSKNIGLWSDNSSILTGGGTTYFYWGPYETILFTYDGARWVIAQGGAIYKAYALANSKGSGTITSVKTTAGAHSTINVSSGAAEFNVPTKTSHLTNDSGFITTDSDEKLKVAEVTSTTQYYPIVGTGTTASTRQYDTTGLKYKGTTGTSSSIGTSILELGNDTASGTAGNKQGILILNGSGNGSSWIYSTPNTNGHTWQFYIPLGTGSIDTKFNLVAANSYNAAVGSSTQPVYIKQGGLVDTCSTYAGGTTVTLNGTSKAASTASFYAPTGAGTSGQVLTSSGSGAPSWTTLSTGTEVQIVRW